MATFLPCPTAKRPPSKLASFFGAGCFSVLAILAAPSRTDAQSLAEWNQIKAKCGLPGGTIYNTWVEQGAPCNQGSAANAAANAQQQLAMQATMAGAKMIGEGLHDALFGKPESPEQQQFRLAAKQLNNSGVWYMRQHDYANAIVELEKALQKTPNDATILGNLTLARRLLEQSSHNSATATHNSDALANVLGALPAASRPSSWDRPENLFQDIDVNFTSNTVNLQNSGKSSVDPASLKKDDPPSGHPLPTPEELNDAFDKAMQTDAKTQAQREQLNSEFDKLVAPTESSATPAKRLPDPVATKKPETRTKQPASTNSQKPAEKP